MPTYEYECRSCGLRFDRWQPITEGPVVECPECRGSVRRLVSGGAGFILQGLGHGRSGKGGSACSMQQTGKTCCGREEQCGAPPCGRTS